MFHYLDKPAVDIIVMNDSQEGTALRSILESFSIQVRLHYVGNVQHFLSLFEDPTFLHSFVIICCHGNERGVLLPELSAELEKQMPVHRVLQAQDIAEKLQLNQHFILNTGCCLGNKNFAKAFMMKGAKGYIGAQGYIEGTAVIAFCVLFFYLYFVKNMPVKEAFYGAQNIDSETKIFRLLEA